MELNAEQIKRALECCGTKGKNMCPYCPYDHDPIKCEDLEGLALEIINSQEQRIKELTEENERLRDSSVDYRNIPHIKLEARADAVREMQERLKAQRVRRDGISFTIDQIAKEMLEGNND